MEGELIPLIDRNPEDEETSFTDVDEDYYRNFSRAVEGNTLEKFNWGSQEKYEAARSKYVTEHGAANIPSWMDLPDQEVAPLFYEDPLKTLEGAKERIIELEPNINLDEIRLSKKNDKIYIRVHDMKSNKWTVEEPLFTKDGEIRAKVHSYRGFQEATRARLKELEELHNRAAALKEVEDLKQQLFDMDKKVKEQEREKEHLIETQRNERSLLNTKIIELETEIQNKTVSTEELQKDLETAKTKLKTLKKSKDASSKEEQTRYKNLEDRMSTISKKLEANEKEIVENRKAKDEAIRKNRDLNKKLLDKNRQTSSLTKERDQLTFELESAVEKFNKESATWSQTEKSLQLDSEEYQKMSRRVKDLEDELQNKEELSKAQVVQLQKERDSLKAQLEAGAPLEQEKQLLGQIRDLQSTVEELKQEKQAAEDSYMRQNHLYAESLKLERDNTKERITTLLDSRNEAKMKLKGAMQTLEKTQKELATVKSEFNHSQVGTEILKQTIKQRDQAQQEVNAKEEQLRQRDQAIEDLERQVEQQREIIRDGTEEEREAARRVLESLQERVAELQSQKENLERTLGLTTKEKIKRALEKAGLGVMFAGAIAGIVSLILNLINGAAVKKAGAEVKSGLKKLGKEVKDMGKKMAASVPGLLGSVLSLILKTGGELLKFLGNNIWILVVALGAVLLKAMTEGRRR